MTLSELQSICATLLRLDGARSGDVFVALEQARSETEIERLKMLEVLTNLMPMPGTPLENQPPVDIFELVRLIATTRIALPKVKVRLSAGRTRLSREGQALCLFAGANSIFYGNKLLTANNPGVDQDRELMKALNLEGSRVLPLQ